MTPWEGQAPGESWLSIDICFTLLPSPFTLLPSGYAVVAAFAGMTTAFSATVR